MYEYMQDKPAEDKKYIQVKITDFYKFLNDRNLENKIREHFMDHHCDVYRKEGMFVYERFFCDDELEGSDWDEDYPEGENIHLVTLAKLKDFLRANGYQPYATYEEKREADTSSLVPGYDGVLFNVTW